MDQIGCTERLTPRHAEGSEIGFKRVGAEEAKARNRGKRGHTDEAARSEEQGKCRQEDEKQEDDDGTRPEAESGEVIGGPVCGAKERVLVLPGFGFVAAAAAVDGFFVVVGRRRRVVGVRGGASQREDPLQHGVRIESVAL